MAAYGRGTTVPGVMQGTVERTGGAKVAFLFTGQGAQYVEMGRQLYETAPTFRAALNRCDELLRPYLETIAVVGTVSCGGRQLATGRDRLHPTGVVCNRVRLGGDVALLGRGAGGGDGAQRGRVCSGVCGGGV